MAPPAWGSLFSIEVAESERPIRPECLFYSEDRDATWAHMPCFSQAPSEAVKSRMVFTPHRNGSSHHSGRRRQTCGASMLVSKMKAMHFWVHKARNLNFETFQAFVQSQRLSRLLSSAVAIVGKALLVHLWYPNYQHCTCLSWCTFHQREMWIHLDRILTDKPPPLQSCRLGCVNKCMLGSVMRCPELT